MTPRLTSTKRSEARPLSALSRRQLRSVGRYLFDQTGDERAGEQFVRELEARILKVAQLSATLGRPRPELGEAIRSLPHHGYVVFLRYGSDSIDVVQVVHARRDLPTTFGES